MVIQIQKGKNANGLFLIFYCLTVIYCFGQSKERFNLSIEQQSILNYMLESGKGKKYIYETTYFDKGWSMYFDQNLNLMFDKVDFPTIIQDDQLRQILTQSVQKEIWTNIIRLKPIKLNKKWFGSNVVLSKSFDRSKDFKNQTFRITIPIIIDNIAVYREVYENQAPIYILKKENNKWEIVYTFYDWNIIED